MKTSCSNMDLQHFPKASALLVAFVLAIASLAPSLHAQTFATWNGAGTDWNTAGNWNGGVPTNATVAEFNSTFSAQPTLSASGVASGIWLADGLGQDVTINVGATTLTLSGTSTIHGSAATAILLDDSANRNLTISGSTVISNNTSFLVNNTGTLTVGTVALGANTLTLGSTLGSGAGNIIMSGSIGGTGGVTINDTAGTSGATLSGINGFTGQLTVASGVLSVAVLNNASTAGAVGNSALSVILGGNGTTGTLLVNGTNTGLSSNKNFILANGGTGEFEITNTNRLTISGTISGSGNLAKSGTSTLTLSGTNTYSGMTSINGGILQVAASANLGNGSATNTIAIANGGILSYTGTANVDLTSNRAIALGAGGGGIAINTSSASLTASGQISGSSLTIDGGGSSASTYSTLILSASNSYSGGTIFNNSSNQFTALAIGDDHALGSGALTFAATRESLQASGGARVITNVVQLGTGPRGSASLIDSISGSDNLTFQGLFTDNSPSAGTGNTLAITNTGLTRFSGGLVLNSGTTAGVVFVIGGAGIANVVGNAAGTGNVTIDSTISDDPLSTGAGLTFTGTNGAVLTLSGSNTFRGALSVGASSSNGLGTNVGINFGIANLQNSAALGAAGGANRVWGGCTLQLQNNIAIAGESLSIIGVGVNGKGALENVSGSNSWGGAITLNGNSTISSDAGALTLSVSGSNAVTGAFTLTLDGSGSINVAGTITTGTGGLTKNGSGIAVLSGSNTYTGATTVNAGVLSVNGRLTSAITVNAGTLQGNGNGTTTGMTTGTIIIGDGVGTNDAILAPGNSVGTFTTASTLTLNSDAQYKFELNSTALTADKIVANGVTINSAATFDFADLNNTGIDITGQQFIVIDNTSGSAISGVFSNLANGGTITDGIYIFTANYAGGTGNDLVLTASVVPEPSTWGMILGGFGMLFGIQRLRQRSVGI